MIRTLLVCESSSFDPYRNLALEQTLLEGVPEETCILYLWQNQNTVVIGKNQNPWAECKTALLEAEGIHLARRLSGGGAVFHDLGNLNFTFLMPQREYDLDKQLGVICDALRSLGIDAERSGRNDILAQGRKFSGNAFYKNGKQAYHHGTLLVDADLDRLSRYLSPSKAKLQSKGVESVRSRVGNLKELNPDITITSLKNALTEAFSRVYHLRVTRLDESAADADRIAALTERNRSWEWNYGQKLPFTLECQERFDWGSVQLQLNVKSGVITGVKVYSDAMDASLSDRVETLLTGCRLDRQALTQRLRGQDLDEVCALVCRTCE